MTREIGAFPSIYSPPRLLASAAETGACTRASWAGETPSPRRSPRIWATRPVGASSAAENDAFASEEQWSLDKLRMYLECRPQSDPNPTQNTSPDPAGSLGPNELHIYLMREGSHPAPLAH